MHFNPHVLLLPVLFAMSGVLAQSSASPSSGYPAVTFPDGDAFVFCSGQDCTGTCEMVDGEYLTITANEGEAAPNDMGFLSIYWYNPGNYDWAVYTCLNGYNCGYPVSIGPDTCYNLYDNGVPTNFYYYWFDTE